MLVSKHQICNNYTFSYRVYLHDPTYHYLVNNPLVSPRVFLQYKDLSTQGGTFKGLYISSTQHHKLNRDTKPCQVSFICYVRILDIVVLQYMII